MAAIFSLVIPLLLILRHYGSAELFTSMSDMEGIISAEKEIVRVIDNYITAEDNRLNKLKETVDEYVKYGQETQESDDYIFNPVNAFLLIKRLVGQWTFIDTLMRYNSADYWLRNITKDVGVKFPGDDDLQGAASALMRLQDTYRLGTAEIADGILQGKPGAKQINADGCFQLCRSAYLSKDYYHTILWCEESLKRMKGEAKPTVDEVEVLDHLAYAYYQQGNPRHALKMAERIATLDPDHPRGIDNIGWYKEDMKEKGISKDGPMPPLVNERPTYTSTDEETIKYEQLCRGELDGTPEELATRESKLYCFYKRNNPFLILAPLKSELVNLEPRIILYRNIISDYEIETIKAFATPKLKRATVFGSDGKLVHVDYRISKSAWLEGEVHPVIDRFNRRLEDMTDLSTDTAELLQIANYGIGGHYEPHFDMSTKPDHNRYSNGGGNRIATSLTYTEMEDFEPLGRGNRIATALTYLDAPEQGGATAFIRLNLALFPTKYDSVFWHNLLKSGSADLTTRHAACPVLSGQKWVANKWFHERGQEFTRPCGMEKDMPN